MSLSVLDSEEHVRRRLSAGGLSEQAVGRLISHVEEVARFWESGNSSVSPKAQHNWFIPGRIEVLGKHTDYAGGSSLTCAVERGFCISASATNEPLLRIVRAATGETVKVHLNEDIEPPREHWANYPFTVFRRVRRNFDCDLQGGTIVFSSNLPQEAGMSSSSAMIVGFFLAFADMNRLWDEPLFGKHLSSPEQLAEYLGAIEAGQAFGPFTESSGVGTFGGSQDHTAILCSEARELRRFSYCPTQFEEAIPAPEGYRFVVADSGVEAEKTGAARERYNRASRLAELAIEHWREATGREDPHLGAAVSIDSISADDIRSVLQRADREAAAEDLVRRFDHFYTENCEVLPAAIQALRAGELSVFGRHVARSQRAAEKLLQNQVPETSFLARRANDIGAVAASAFGAGFGGSVWALVDADKAESFRQEWRNSYADEFPAHQDRADFFIERPGPSAFRL